MLSNLLKNLSILKKFLFINFIFFTIIGIFLFIYLKNVQPNLIKKKSSNHIEVINNTIDNLTRLNVEFVEDLLPILEVAAREARPLLIVAENIEGQALAALIMNAVRGTMRVVAVKAPRYGQERRNILSDLATSVGATFVSRDSGLRLKDAKLENLGRAKSIDIYKNATTIVDGAGDIDETEIDDIF